MPKEPKLSLTQRVKLNIVEKSQSVNTKFEAKFPSAHKKTTYYANYMKEVWNETFPNDKAKAKTKIDERKERARVLKEHQDKMKEMS